MTLLEEPNIFSPANLDASNMWRDRRNEFLNKAKEMVELARKNIPAGICFYYYYYVFLYLFLLFFFILFPLF